MGRIRRQTEEHRCKRPTIWPWVREGDQWRCNDCGTLWQTSGPGHPSHPRLSWVRPVDLDNLPRVSGRPGMGAVLPDFDG